MGSIVSRKLAGISIVVLIALLAVRLDGLKHARRMLSWEAVLL